jgi:pyruvate dehydrogenase E2 component (dihydrolipoamide acetyltransferase)
MSEFKLPFLGPDVEEAKLLAWQVRAGDQVQRGQVVCVVDTAKAAVDVEAWQEGTVQALLVEPGEQVHVGQALLEFAANTGECAPAARQRVSPAARMLAQAHRIDVASLRGSGPEGTVCLADVQQVIDGKAPEMPQPVPAGMRQVIAAAMSRSKREIPHYYLSEDIPLAAAQAWLAEQNAKRPIEDRLLMAALLLKAVALARVAAPGMNCW